MPRVIVEDGVVVTGDGRVLDGATVVIEGDRIAAVHEDGRLPVPAPGDWHVPADGRLVTPGLVDAWMVLPDGRARAAAALVDALEAGVTTCIATADGVPATEIAELAARLGLRLFLAPRSEAPGQASRRVAHAARSLGPSVLPAVTVAGAALADEALLGEAAGVADELSAPLCLPAAVDASELGRVFEAFHERPVERLDALALLGERTVIVHGNLLDSSELDTLAGAGATLVACPRESAAIGAPTPLDRALDRGVRLALGTGRRGTPPLAELAGAPPGGPMRAALPAALEGGAALVSRLLGRPLGRIAPGHLADLVVHGLRPSRPASEIRWPGAAPWGLGAAWAVVGGEVVLREGRPLGVDARAVADAARAGD